MGQIHGVSGITERARQRNSLPQAKRERNSLRAGGAGERGRPYGTDGEQEKRQQAAGRHGLGNG